MIEWLDRLTGMGYGFAIIAAFWGANSARHSVACIIYRWHEEREMSGYHLDRSAHSIIWMCMSGVVSIVLFHLARGA